jgi:proteic killer suppression protein
LRIEIRDSELRRIVEDPDLTPKRWSTDVIRAFRKKMQLLEAATDERDIRAYKALRLERLAGDRAGTSSIRINDQYRLILRFETDDDGRIVIVLELVDYH